MPRGRRQIRGSAVSTLVLNSSSLAVGLEGRHLIIRDHAGCGGFQRVPLVDVEKSRDKRGPFDVSGVGRGRPGGRRCRRRAGRSPCPSFQLQAG